MAQMASGEMERLAFHESFVMDFTATSSTKKSFSLPVMSNYVIICFIDEVPSTPDPNIYIALSFATTRVNGTSPANATCIYRPNGTIGTDGGMCGYDTTTGELLIGGTYGYFPQGTKYHIYAFEIGS